MSKKQESVSSKIKDDKEKLATNVVVALELNHGLCDIAHVKSYNKKNDEQIGVILEHTKTTESHAC